MKAALDRDLAHEGDVARSFWEEVVEVIESYKPTNTFSRATTDSFDHSVMKKYNYHEQVSESLGATSLKIQIELSLVHIAIYCASQLCS